jgi:cytochrome o ubiquinol oxidase subunit 3
MSHSIPLDSSHSGAPDTHQDFFTMRITGFWIYLMTDCLIFATLFATYGVLHKENFGGPTTSEVYSLKTAFFETMVLLLSSVACGFAMLSSVQSKKNAAVMWLIITFLLGATFVATELTEFTHLVLEGNGWTKSAFLSSFFTLVGTHGLHVSVGLFWMLVMIVQVAVMGVTVDTFRRLGLLTMFWHFLDLVWIFIFTFVYLIGVLE